MKYRREWKDIFKNADIGIKFWSIFCSMDLHELNKFSVYNAVEVKAH